MGAPLIAGMIASVIANEYLQKKANNQQLEQQEKLTKLQREEQQKLNEHSKNLNMETWNDTNYGAQKAQMKSAGLNAGLMYKSAGQGGTLGSASGAVGGATAEPQGMGMVANARAMMELATLKAQKENIEADTANKTADTANKPKTGANLDADLASKLTENQRAQLQLHIERVTQASTIDQIEKEAIRAGQEVDKLAYENGILGKTQQTQIQMIQQNAVEQGIRIEQARKNLNMTDAQIKKIGEEIIRMKAQTRQGDEALSIQEKEQLTKQLQMEFNTSTPAEIKQWVDIGESASKIYQNIKSKTSSTSTTENDFSEWDTKGGWKNTTKNKTVTTKHR